MSITVPHRTCGRFYVQNAVRPRPYAVPGRRSEVLEVLLTTCSAQVPKAVGLANQTRASLSSVCWCCVLRAYSTSAERLPRAAVLEGWDG
jgi:hypothetical protein